MHLRLEYEVLPTMIPDAEPQRYSEDVFVASGAYTSRDAGEMLSNWLAGTGIAVRVLSLTEILPGDEVEPPNPMPGIRTLLKKVKTAFPQGSVEPLDL